MPGVFTWNERNGGFFSPLITAYYFLPFLFFLVHFNVSWKALLSVQYWGINWRRSIRIESVTVEGSDYFCLRLVSVSCPKPWNMLKWALFNFLSKGSSCGKVILFWSAERLLPPFLAGPISPSLSPQFCNCPWYFWQFCCIFFYLRTNIFLVYIGRNWLSFWGILAHLPCWIKLYNLPYYPLYL